MRGCRLDRWRYTFAGLRIASDLPLPEWATFEEREPFTCPDVLIVLDGAKTRSRRASVTGSEAPRVQQSAGSLAPWAGVNCSAADDEESDLPGLPIVRADECRFVIPAVGFYWVRGGREIVLLPAPGAGERQVRLFLLGAAWSVLCYQRGLLVLHASVVQIGRYAVAFCGETGSGKSTLAAWLVKHGYRSVSDDLCCLDIPAGGQPRAYPSASHLKLWRDALGALGWSDEGLERDHPRLDKLHADLTGSPARGSAGPAPLPLRAIYLLAWGECSVARLTGMTALRRMVASGTHHGEWLEPMGQVAAHWERCAALVRCVPVWEFARPRDWMALDAAMRLLTAGWESG